MQPARGRPDDDHSPALEATGDGVFAAARFRRSLGHAAAGIAATWRSQPNFRIQVACAWAAALATCLLDLSPGETLAVALAAGLVLAAELFNTALEAVVDLVTKERHPLARTAKDAAAGAVLALSLLSLVVAALVFVPKLHPLRLRPHGTLWALPLALPLPLPLLLRSRLVSPRRGAPATPPPDQGPSTLP